MLIIDIKPRFGKILGMSTRKGSMVTVEELLKEAKAVMVESQLKSRNTRVEGVEVHEQDCLLQRGKFGFTMI